MTKQDKYKAQLMALGVWDEAFKPAVEELATLERELSRARKQWKATAPDDEAPDVLDKHYDVICKLRAEILQHRDALGLTPRGLRRLRPKDADLDSGSTSQTASPGLSEVLDKIKAAAGGADE